MKKYLYLLVVIVMPLMATHCEKESLYTSRHLQTLAIECPDTVASGAPFEMIFHVRMADCEKLRLTSKLVADTMYFTPMAERRNTLSHCDTSQPFIRESTTLTFGTTGMKKLIFWVGMKQIDSVYIK